jgi:CheY-like chemotaxis protein
MHGGSVEAHSEGEHRGATFTVSVPVRAVNVADSDRDPRISQPDGSATWNEALQVRPPVRLEGVRVLVVDDEHDTRRMLKEVLESAGANVTVTESAQEALEALTLGQGGFDVLLSDIGMPNQDGYDLIREVRRRGSDSKVLPAIALTGFARADDAREALSAGFQTHIPKPVEVHGLTATIASLARRLHDTA